MTPNLSVTPVAPNLSSFGDPKRHFPSVVHRIADQGIAASKLKNFLDARRVIADHIDNQFHVPRLADFTV